MTVESVVQSVFGYQSLRPEQSQVVAPLLAGQDVFNVAATGSGKALTFQVPALVLPHTTVIISPLVALMADQTLKLQSLNVNAVSLTAEIESHKLEKALSNLNQFKIVYVSPERALTAPFLAALSRAKISLVAADECHFISRTSVLRPEYGRLHEVVEACPEAVRYACTATADAEDEKIIRRVMRLRDPVRVISSPWRDNLKWEFHHQAKLEDLVTEIEGTPGQKLIYTASKKEAESVSKEMEKAGLTWAYYHAGLPPDVRKMVQEQFMDGTLDGLSATSAFGTGVDAPKIRLVGIWQTPGSLFDLLQMGGRASRDGQPGRIWVRTGGLAERTHRFLLMTNHPPLKVYQRLMAAFSETCEPRRWPLDMIRSKAQVGKEFDGWATSALGYLDLTDHIRTGPAGQDYIYETRDKSSAARVAKIFGLRTVAEDTYRYRAQGEDRSDQITATGAFWKPTPIPALMITPLTADCRITEEEIADRKDRAEKAMADIGHFARASDRKAFVEKTLLSSVNG